MTLRALLAKDARIVLRNRALLLALLAYPILLALTLGAAFSEPPTRLDLAIVNHDAAGASVETDGATLSSADLVDAARDIAHVVTPTTEDDAISLLRRGEVDAVLIVPRGFVRDLVELGDGATLRLLVDEADPVRASVARSTVVGALDAFVRAIIERKIADVQDLLNVVVDGGSVRVIVVDVNVLGVQRSRELLQEVLATHDSGSPEARKLRDVLAFLEFATSTLSSADAYLRTTAMPLDVAHEGFAAKDAGLAAIALPGALILGVFWTGSLAAALLIARERETGAIRRLAAAPRARLPAALSKTLIAIAAALLPALALVALAIPTLGAVLARPLLTLLTLALAALAAASLGAIAASLARGTAAASLLAILALLPMLLLAGLFYPIAHMPPIAQTIARALPVTLATDALRGAMIRASPTLELAPALFGLVAFAALAGIAAGALARRA